MNKLVVLYNEDKLNPKNTWSGTSYSLRTALEKYCDVIFVDSSRTIFEDVIFKIINKLGKRTSTRLLDDFFNYLYSARINKKIKDFKNIPVLEIANAVKLKNDFYLYHDLSYYCWIESNIKIAKLGHSFANGNLNVFCDRELNRRIFNEKKLIEASKGVFYMGNWVARNMQMRYPEIGEKKIFFAGGGLNTDFVLKKAEKNPNQIIFIGIDFERKAGDLVVEAFRILKDNYIKNAKLVIIGSGQQKEENGVMWLGKLDREEISEHLAQSSVFCMPSRFEAYGLAFIEAHCFGLPVVARNDYEMRYFVEDGKDGYLISDDNAEELAKTLDKAIKNRDMHEYVENNKEIYLRQYSWDNVAKTITRKILGE